MAIDRRMLLAGVGATVMLGRAGRAAMPPHRIPITLTDKRVVVNCKIGTQGPFRFVLDTGGTIGLIDLNLARQLRLKELGKSVLGLKQGRAAYPIFAVPDLSFGDQVRQPMSTIAGVEALAFHDGAVSSIAAGALTAGDCELDFDVGEWRIYRDGMPDRGSWSRYDKGIFRYGNADGSAFMAGDAVLGGRSIRFGLDTGMLTTMSIYRKAAEEAGLWNAPRWSPAAPGGMGRVVRAPLQLTGVTIPDALITMTENPVWDAFPNGVIGLPILRRFNIATIAKEEAVFLKRNRLPALPERYNRAGLWIERAGQDARIVTVGAGSPAAKAGMAAGDRLIGIDFSQLVQRMFDPIATVLPLTVERGGHRRDLQLPLQDFL